jgi:uncharacterized ferredoxin-like protein
MEFDEGLRIVASLMDISARTAPKARGIDTIVTKTLTGDELQNVAVRMEEMGKQLEAAFFIRDAASMRSAGACFLIGCRGFEAAGVNCGACGKKTCNEIADQTLKRGIDTVYSGPNCALRITDLGIAVGSAVKTASIHNVDNRVLFSAGCAALSLGLLPECTIAYAVPLSVSGKSIFSDRVV